MVPEVDLRCERCNMRPFDPYAFEYRSGLRGGSFVWAPREGFCGVESHYPGHEED